MILGLNGVKGTDNARIVNKPDVAARGVEEIEFAYQGRYDYPIHYYGERVTLGDTLTDEYDLLQSSVT